MDWVIFVCCNSNGWGWQQQSQGHGFDSQGIHKLIQYLPWMLCKSLWVKVFVKWMNVNLWGTQSRHEKRSSTKRWKTLIWWKLWHSHRYIPHISEWNLLIDLIERGESKWNHFTSILARISERNRIFSQTKKCDFFPIDNWLHHKTWMLHTRSDCKLAVHCGEMLWKMLWKYSHLTPFLYDSYFCGTQKIFLGWTIPLTLIFSQKKSAFCLTLF